MKQASDPYFYRCTCPSPIPRHSRGECLSGIIDMHCHVFVPEAESIVSNNEEFLSLSNLSISALGEASFRHNKSMMHTLNKKLVDVNTRLMDMDSLGVEIQVLSPSPTQYHYWAEPDLSQQIVSMQNERIMDICNHRPDRFMGLGTVSLQHPDLAVEQLKSAIDIGLKGVEISTYAGDRELSDPVYDHFWRTAERLKAIIFLHPFGTTLGNRLSHYYLANVIGQPLETTIALSHLIFSGVFDRHPTLKILAAHAGGFLPAYFGRSNHAYFVRPEASSIRSSPKEYLDRIWFDTVIHDPELLANMIRYVGVDNVVVGTDYPFDMGEYRVASLMMEAGMSVSDRLKVIKTNAEKLLGIVD